MSGFWSLRSLYMTGAVASILAFLWTVSAVGVPFSRTAKVASSPSEPSQTQATFELTGTPSTDVQKALILMGKLEGEVGDVRRRDVKKAIEQAERNLGLPTDGVADHELARQLKAKLDEKELASAPDNRDKQQSATIFGWTPDDWAKMGQAISAFSGVILAWLGFFRSSRKPDEAAG